jgi:hypothetical protein
LQVSGAASNADEQNATSPKHAVADKTLQRRISPPSARENTADTAQHRCLYAKETLFWSSIVALPSPWLRFLRARPAQHVHFWPFDGLAVPVRRSVFVQVNPHSGIGPSRVRAAPQISTTPGVSRSGPLCRSGQISHGMVRTKLTSEERKRADFEGWIFAVS